MVALGRWFTRRALLALKFLSGYVHRGTLPQSRPLGVTAPSGREPGGLAPFIGVLAKIQRWRAIFIAPTKAQKILVYTIQRGTLPQSRPLGVPAPSEREPGCGLYHSSGCSLKSNVGGRFSSPLRRLRRFAILPFNGGHSLSHALWA